MEQSLVGEVRQIVYNNEENGYLVARVKAADEPGLVTVVGVLGKVTPGEMLDMQGQWKEHPRFGRQFEVNGFRQTCPATENGIIRYLSSGLIKGVGRATAERLVEHFGTGILEILENEPDRLLRVEGIGRKKLEAIVESWDAQREVRALMLFLQTHGVPTTYAARIYQLYGDDAVSLLRENPFELTYTVRGIGFRTADQMAMQLGLSPESAVRLEAAVVYALFNKSERGHLFVPREPLVEEVEQMLGGVSRILMERAVDSLAEKKRVVVEELPEQGLGEVVWLHHFYRFEKEIAARLHGLVTHPAASTTVKKVREMLPSIERESGISLSPEQREAILEAVARKAFIITGGPGTGKTTITRMVVRALGDADLKVKLAAPTGRAAKRLSEASGVPASTLHRLLQYTPEGGFQLNEDNKLKTDCLLVDEASMLDVQLFMALLRALKPTCRLILVGDVNQLPSVGPGNVLADLLQSECVPSARLSHIFRQARESHIVVNAHRINAGEPPVDAPGEPPEADFFWVRQDEPERVRDMIVQLVTERIPARYGLDPVRDIQVLTPMHKGEAGTMSLNGLLQERLNPSGPCVTRGRMTLRRGDRVMQLRNNYDKDVFNGDLGWVEAVDPDAGEVLVDFDGRGVAFESSELDDLTLAYAVSVHKSQGSEYPAVVIPVMTQHYVLLQRNLLYTALTRARRLAVMIGSEKAMRIGLSNTGAVRRHTNLRFRLQDLFNE